jgi:mannose-1-phosphate guanylyltransferase/mannose-6-phosphate isomerase
MADATIILAGGAGTRLWPASISGNPKQLLRIGGGPSLIQRAITLALAATATGPLVIVTNRDHVRGIQEHVAELEIDSPGVSRRIVFLPEPVGRNTAPAVALGIVYLRSILNPDATALVLTADHVIGPPDRFVSDANAACELAASGNLVCFGITPDRPETGYGYIRAGARRERGFRVESFTEKPDLATAREYLATGDYYWNAGMFCFTLGGFMGELAVHSPEIAGAFENSLDAVRTGETAAGSLSANPDDLAGLYAELPRISIDYALMERSTLVAVVPATFSWSDVGSWDEVARAVGGTPEAESDPNSRSERSVAKDQSLIEVESHGNYVDSDLPVAICGVSDIHVVVRNGKVLVCRRGSSQLVKEVVDSADADGRREFL